MKAYTNSDKTVMEFAGHERLDTDRHYQHAVETERRRIISGMENDAKDAIPSVSGNDVPVPRNAGGTSVRDCPSSGENRRGGTHTLLKVMDANEREEVMRRLSPETKEETLSRMLMEPQ